MSHQHKASKIRAQTCVLLYVALSACAGGPPAADGHYHARGVVAAISGSAPDAELSIHHEAIPRFKDRDGHATTMASMTMIFGLAEPSARAGLHVGDKLAFEFDLRWNARPVLLITKLAKLPADTPLTLSGE
jgi:hypothetical protein